MRSELTSAAITNIGAETWNGSYTYHKNGDMDKRTVTGTTETTFTYVGNLMDTAAGGETFDLGYDLNGNLQENNMSVGDDTALVWNWDNKLRSATKGSNSMSLKYDPMGNRIYKNSSITGARKYIVDVVGDLPVILMELNGTSVTKTYIYANSQILAQHDGPVAQNNKYFYLHDRLGSVREIIDSTGAVVKYYTYAPFGDVIEQGGTFDNAFMFTGQYYDSEIDQYPLRARDYNPYISRFTSRDPVDGEFERPLTLHKYLYCGNNPINKIDPSGEWAILYPGGLTWSAQVGPLGGGGSVTPFFFYGMSDDLTFFCGWLTFAEGGFELPPGLGGFLMYSVGWSPNAQSPEDLAGTYIEGGGSVGFGFAGGASVGWSLETGTILELYSAGVGIGRGGHGYIGTTTILDSITIGGSE
jgi:RHS repeat-associated protein